MKDNQKVYIGTNWKMHKTIKEGREYCRKLKQIRADISDRIELFIIPPFTSLHPLQQELERTDIKLGAQNMHAEPYGPYTGEISPVMLEEIGVDIVELGHSERRQLFNETDDAVQKKAEAALSYNMTPLICIGETLDEKEKGVGREKLSAQLKISLEGLSYDEIQRVWIAYEPVWSIGEHGKPATPEHVEESHQFIREKLREQFGSAAADIPLLYGGSVNQQNVKEYLHVNEVDGLFIGRSAWDLSSFETILKSI
ncbi:triose-phosphate isomerase [Salibacterium qingdaonense]|uniref:Triosephosphate isomerase n=1 Tax=Salibacterium qingdaonense TaxID=266892 RepID=A0A1I4P2B9_9BACI|nr:triose-phosphate isomerase [Salibacterium qingdaonense]SFM21503.1 triosephosphate isomerase [Salibacterium qingdaonense]